MLYLAYLYKVAEDEGYKVEVYFCLPMANKLSSLGLVVLFVHLDNAKRQRGGGCPSRSLPGQSCNLAKCRDRPK